MHFLHRMIQQRKHVAGRKGLGCSVAMVTDHRNDGCDPWKWDPWLGCLCHLATAFCPLTVSPPPSLAPSCPASRSRHTVSSQTDRPSRRHPVWWRWGHRGCSPPQRLPQSEADFPFLNLCFVGFSILLETSCTCPSKNMDPRVKISNVTLYFNIT